MPVVLGIDLGTHSVTVAAVKPGKGVEVLCNEFSHRQTPVLVAFAEKVRNIGESAATSLTFNFKNTVTYVKQLLGRKYSQIPKDVLDQVPCELSSDENDEILIHVTYMNEKRVFTPVQVLAMFFTKIKEMSERETRIPGVSAVIAVPPYFNDKQRNCVLEAAKIAKMDCIRLVSDTLAAAIEYAIYRTPTDKDDIKYSAFVDIGHCHSSVSIVGFTSTDIKMICSANDSNLGSMHFENVLVDHLIEESKKNYDLDVRSNPKALLRLRKEAEKLKKILSANPVGQLRMECFMNDKDVAFKVNREEFEEMCKPILTKFDVPIKKALELSKLSPDKIETVELIGGGSYIPSLRIILSDIFQQKCDFHCNASESVARGSAFAGAMISRTIRLKKSFNIYDAVMYPVKLGWKSGEEVKFSKVFSKLEKTPNSKMLTFNKSSEFSIYAAYDNMELHEPGTQAELGEFLIQNIPKKDEGTSKVKVQVSNDLNGMVNLEGAQLIEEREIEVDEPIPQEENKKTETEQPKKGEEKKGEAKDTEMKEEEKKEENPKTRKVKKKKTFKTNLPIQRKIFYASSPEFITQATFDEEKMIKQDLFVAQTEEARNNLESFIYSLQDKLFADFEPYIVEDQRDELVNELQESEDWLYNEGEAANKEEFENKLWGLKKKSNVIEERKFQDENRPKAIELMNQTLKYCTDFVNSKDEKYSHITDEDKSKIAKEVESIMKWLNEQIQVQSSIAKNQDSVLKAQDIENKRNQLASIATPIMSKPKPKPKEEKKEETNVNDKQNKEQPKPNKDEQQEEEMDLD